MIPHAVLLIVIDTLRQDHLGCYGYHRNTSPFIDRLAKEGRVYTRAFSPVPVTLPAHACIFTQISVGMALAFLTALFPLLLLLGERLKKHLIAGFVSGFAPTGMTQSSLR
jgi:hypothetical protein